MQVAHDATGQVAACVAHGGACVHSWGAQVTGPHVTKQLVACVSHGGAKLHCGEHSIPQLTTGQGVRRVG